jgi:hypothetical protein
MRKIIIIATLTLAVRCYSQDSTNPVPVVIVEQSQPDVYPAFATGFGFGLTIFGFGWTLRLAKRVVRPDNG